MGLNDKHIKNIFIYVLPKFLGYALSFITLPILTRFLTPRDFGIVAMASLFPAIAVGVCTCGIGSAVHRFYFEYRNDPAKLSSFYVSIQIFLFFVFCLFAAGVYFFRGHIATLTVGSASYGDIVWFVSLGAFIGQISSFYLTMYQNEERANVYAFFTVMQSLLTAVITVMLVCFFKLSYRGFVYGSVLGAAVTGIALFCYFNAGKRGRFDGRLLLDNVLYGLQFVPESFNGFVNRFFDKYMLTNLLSLTVVGIYNIGLSVGNTVFVLMSAVWSSFQPVYYKEVFDRGQAASRSVGRIFTIFAFLVLTPVLFGVVFARELIIVLAPASYYAAIDVIVIALCAIAMNVFGMYVGVQFAYRKKAIFLFPISVAATAVNVVCNIVLIPRFGLAGAALSFLAMYFVNNVILVLVGQRLYFISFEWRIIAGFIGMIFAGAAISILLQRFCVPIFYAVGIKIVLVACYAGLGMAARIVSWANVKRLYSSVAGVS